MTPARLVGQETEYAIRISVLDGAPTPTRRSVFEWIAAHIRASVKTGRGRVSGALSSFFVQNGGNFSYEALPWAIDAGLLEGATPECRSAAQVVTYQRAQERLLVDALRRVREDHAGVVDVGLLKNGRDAWGHVYGTQENYEVVAARGPWLWAYRLGLVALLPVSLGFFVVSLAYLLLLGALVLVLSPLLVVGLFIGLASQRLPDSFASGQVAERWLEASVWRLTAPLQALGVAMGTPYCWWVAWCLFRRERSQLTAFLISRLLLSGTGTLEPDGRFLLSEKATGMRYVVRRWATPAAHAVFDTGNLLKQFMGSLEWWSSYRRLFERRQRLQLGLSDGNRAQVAELLKLGTALLLFDLVERGELADAPRLKRPLDALQCVTRDLQLSTPLELYPHPDLGDQATALELQRWYCERAMSIQRQDQAVRLEQREMLSLWHQTLDLLESSSEALVGSLDWWTKRSLIVGAGADASYDAQKKIDLKYHELGVGYFDRLEEAGLTARVVTEAEVEAARYEPPRDTPARLRGELIAELTDPERALVGWGQIRVGGGVRGKVVRLDAFRGR